MIIFVFLSVVIIIFTTLNVGFDGHAGFVFLALLIGSCIKSVSLYWRDIDFSSFRWFIRRKSHEEQRD
jgi:hypothetical protein